jgi:hypothetical protein
VAFARVCPASSSPSPGVGQGLPSFSPDEDDGIHIASVTPVGGPEGPVLRVVVAWFEEGRRVERLVELAGEAETRAETGPT